MKSTSRFEYRDQVILKANEYGSNRCESIAVLEKGGSRVYRRWDNKMEYSTGNDKILAHNVQSLARSGFKF